MKVIVVLLLLFGSFPLPILTQLGYAPNGILGTILLIVVVLYLLKIF